MSTCMGYAAGKSKAPLGPYRFERREPREHDVVIDIKYCGICPSDIHQARNQWSEYQEEVIFPMVPGHEIAGIVTAVGSKVSKYKIGDKAGVGCYVDSCRTCPECNAGMEQYCSVQTVWTYNGRDQQGAPTYGGYSDRIVADENYVLRMPSNLPLEQCAPLLCAGITVYSPLRHWGAGPGKKVAVVGLGGLGHMGVKIAHAMGAEVTVLSQSLKKQDDGVRLGADHYFATSDPATFEELAGSFDLIVNTVSAKIDLDGYLSLLARDGALVNVGAPAEPLSLNAFSLIFGRESFAGSAIGGIR